MTKKRVVITGMGTVNPLGNNVEEYWQNLIKSKSGISNIDEFDVSKYTTKIAGRPKDFDPTKNFDKKEIRRRSSNFKNGSSTSPF